MGKNKQHKKKKNEKPTKLCVGVVGGWGGGVR